MMFHLASAPADGARLVGEAYGKIAPRRGRALGFFGPRPPPPSAPRPIPVWTIPLSALRGKDAQAHAYQVGWRYLIKDGDQLLTVDLGGAGEQPLRFNALHRGGAERFAQACGVATALDTPGQQYDLRLLSLPSVHVEGLWLASDNDRFVRLRSPRSSVVEPFDLLAEARDIARRREDVADGDDDGATKARPD